MPYTSATSDVEYLSEDKIGLYKDVFSLFDDDNDGIISTRQLGDVLRKLGMSPTEGEVNEMIEKVDCDGSGTIDFPEFLRMMSNQTEDFDHETEIRETFRMFDKDGDGFITAGELRYMFANMGQKLSDEEINEMIMDADVDGDGRINYAEFFRLM